jgi:hypothetical protein
MYNLMFIENQIKLKLNIEDHINVKKYINFICSIVERDLGVFVESHHILPKCYFPELHIDNDNLVWLTPHEHYIAHKLLAFIGKNNKLWYAFNMMKNTREENRLFDDAEYNLFKIKIYSELSEYNKINSIFVDLGFQKEMNRRRWNKIDAKTNQSLLLKNNNPMRLEENRIKVSLSKIGKPRYDMRGSNNIMHLEKNKEKFRGKNNPKYIGFIENKLTNIKHYSKDSFIKELQSLDICSEYSIYFLKKIYNYILGKEIFLKDRDKAIVIDISKQYHFISK